MASNNFKLTIFKTKVNQLLPYHGRQVKKGREKWRNKERKVFSVFVVHRHLAEDHTQNLQLLVK